MPKPSFRHPAFGRFTPRSRILRAAFGMALPEDDDSTQDDFHDATHFDPAPYYYAEGGQIDDEDEDGIDLRKAEWEHQKDELSKPPAPDERQKPSLRDEDPLREMREKHAAMQRAEGATLAEGGRVPKLGSGKRFAHLEKSIAARGDVRDPGAVAASIGRRKYGAKKFAALAAHGRAAHRASGGAIENPRASFADAMARRMRIRYAMRGR